MGKKRLRAKERQGEKQDNGGKSETSRSRLLCMYAHCRSTVLNCTYVFPYLPRILSGGKTPSPPQEFISSSSLVEASERDGRMGKGRELLATLACDAWSGLIR